MKPGWGGQSAQTRGSSFVNNLVIKVDERIVEAAVLNICVEGVVSNSRPICIILVINAPIF